MIVSWLFEIGAYKWSTKAVTFGGDTYTATVLPESFNGISMNWDIERQGLITPSEIDFEISNPDGAITKASLEDQYCTIILVTNGVECRRWKFKVQSAVSAYGLMTVYCVDILQDCLLGSFPNTPHPREIWPSKNHEADEDDGYRIPVIFGEAYIPLMYIYRASDSTGYYVLGKYAGYTISEVKAPPSKGKTVWTNAEYVFSQIADSGYSLAELFIAPTDEDGVYDAGTWESDLQPLVKYKVFGSSPTSVSPCAVLSTLLQSFGVDILDIDTAGTWASATSTFASWGITWRGGFYQSESRETILNNLLSQCDSNLYISDKIELLPFSTASQETFDKTKTKKLSFQSSKTTRPNFDSGRVHWALAGSPQNELSGKTIVPLEVGGTTENPDSEIFEAKFITDGRVAQRIGRLHFQRKTAKETVSFSTAGPVMTSLATLKPGQVITVDGPLFGGSQQIVVTSLDIKRDLEVSISGVRLKWLQEFTDTTADDITIGGPGTPTMGDPTVKLLQLNPSALVFKYDSEGNPDPAVQTITFTAESQNLDAGDYVFSTIPNIKTYTGSSRFFTLSNTEFGINDRVDVTVAKDGLTNTVAIFRLQDGPTGPLSQSTLKSFSFLRSATQPDTPVGGSYSLPTATDWSDGIPAGTLPVWQTTRIFTSDGLAPQQEVWSTPYKVGELGQGARVQFSVNHIDWHDTPSVNDVYMRSGVSTDGGATWTDSGYVKIKGEEGAPGDPGADGIDAGNWGSTLVFSSTSYNSVSWAAGNLYSGVDGRAISAGSVTDMSTAAGVVYYIYFDPAVSTTALQKTTTASLAVGSGKVLVAVAKANPVTTSYAQFQAFGGAGGLMITADNIAANTITGNKFVSSLVVTSQIRDSSSNLVIDFGAAAITVNSTNGLVVNGNGSIKITDPAAQNSNINATWGYKSYFAANAHLMNIVSSYATSQFTISGYKAQGFLGGMASIGGNVNTAYRLTCSASTMYDTFSYAAQFEGDVHCKDSLVVSDQVSVAGNTFCQSLLQVTGNAVVYGNTGIGLSVPSEKLDVLGKIKASNGLIPSTSSGTITDFEEGVYTAILTPGSGSITLNSAWNKLQYTKIGKMVTVCGKIYIASVASPTGTLLLNLPLARTNSSGLSGNSSGSITYENVNTLPANNCLCLYGEAAATIAITFAMTTGQNGTTAIYMKASTFLFFNFSYTAA